MIVKVCVLLTVRSRTIFSEQGTDIAGTPTTALCEHYICDFELELVHACMIIIIIIVRAMDSITNRLVIEILYVGEKRSTLWDVIGHITVHSQRIARIEESQHFAVATL